MSWEDDGEWLVYSDLERCVWHGRQWTDPNESLLDRSVQTCNPGHFSRGCAVASETSDLSAQAGAYDVEILQCGNCLLHKELYQVRYVRSRWTCVLHSGCVRSRGEHFPIDRDYVVIACCQISWEENSACLQILCTHYLFPSVLTVWLVLNLWDLRLWLKWILKLMTSVVGCNIMWYDDRYWRFEG